MVGRVGLDHPGNFRRRIQIADGLSEPIGGGEELRIAESEIDVVIAADGPALEGVEPGHRMITAQGGIVGKGISLHFGRERIVVHRRPPRWIVREFGSSALRGAVANAVMERSAGIAGGEMKPEAATS